MRFPVRRGKRRICDSKDMGGIEEDMADRRSCYFQSCSLVRHDSNDSSICRTFGKSRPSCNLHCFYCHHLHQFWIFVGYGKHVGDSVWTSLRRQAVPYAGDLSPTFVDCSVPLCNLALAHVHLCYSHLEADWADYRSCREIRKGAAFAVHVFVSWLFVSKLRVGIVGTAIVLDFSWWLTVLGLFVYMISGECRLTWTGFSSQAIVGLWPFLKLSIASGIMLCLENVYYRMLIIVSGYLEKNDVAVDALSICMTIFGCESMIPLGFLAAAGVRVANELGAGNSKGAKFAAMVSAATSLVVGLLFFAIIMGFHNSIALFFSSSAAVIKAVNKLSVQLAITILFNCIQPVLSGVAVGSGWQAIVAYINIGCYYFIGVPLGIFLGWFHNSGIWGIWIGMIGGTVVQTLILIIITVRCDWKAEAKKATNHIERPEYSNQ